MIKILIAYYSRSGNTKKMAEYIKEGVVQGGAQAVIKDIESVHPNDLLDFDGIVIGSPTYYGTLSCQVKKLFDESVSLHGKLDGKVGAAFSSAANIGGGNETAIMSILQAMLIHGMIIQGDPKGDHYGSVSINKVDERSINQCHRQGERLAKLITALKK